MGLDKQGVRLLLDARAHGANFEQIATIGRQSLHIDAPTLSGLLRTYGLSTSEPEAATLLTVADGFCEPLLELLGARNICSIDVSSYENATVLHDMNDPIGENLRNRFSVVVESGSLEHVFNFPRAIANCMQMVKTGGHLLAVTPTNNQMGHGFYQFSPELYFRVLSPANGFAIERLVAYQDCWPFDQWYAVRDPADVKSRVTLLNRHPAFLLVSARKVEDIPLFSRTPQQSDYVAVWDKGSFDGHGTPRQSNGTVRQAASRAIGLLLPESVKRRYQLWRAGGVPFDPAFYERLDDEPRA